MPANRGPHGDRNDVPLKPVLSEDTKMYFTRHASIALFTALAITTCAVGQDTIPWHYDLSQAPRLAEQQQRLVLLHFWSDNCAPCQRVEANVFSDPTLIRAISTSFIPVKINVQQQPKIASYYKVDQFPTDVIVLPNGRELYRKVSPQKPNAYIAMLDQVRANAMQNGLQEINQLASKADRFAQRAQQQVQQFSNSLPALPPRNDEDESSAQSVNSDLGAFGASNAGSEDPLRSALGNTGRAIQDARSAIVNNEFVGPLDRKVEAKPAVPAGRQVNPYLENQTQTPAQSPPNIQTPALPNQTVPQLQTQAEERQPLAPTQPQPQATTPQPQAQTQAAPALSGNRWTNADPNTGRDAAPQYLSSRPEQTQPPQYSGAPQLNQNALNVPAQSPPQYDPIATQPRPAADQGGAANYANVQPRQPQVPEVTAPTAQYPIANTLPQDPASAGSFNNRQPTYPQQPLPQQQQPPAVHPSAPPLALDGFCPVTLMEGQKWEQGNPQFGVIHRGRTYLFRTAMERDRFMAPGAADHYAPVLSGYDAVRFAELHQTVEGSRAFGVVYQDQIYLFADEQALLQFEQQPQKYVSIVRQAMLNARSNPQR